MPITLRQIRHTDPEPVISALNAAGHEVSIGARAGDEFMSFLDFVRLPNVEIFRIGFPRFHARSAEPIDFFGVTISDSTGFHSPTTRAEIDPGDCLVMRPGEGFDLHATSDGALFVVNFFGPLREQLSRAFQGRDRLSLQSTAGSSFHRFARFVWNEARSGALPADATVITHIQDLLQSTLIATSRDQQERHRYGPAVPRYVRVAQDYIHAHLGEPLPMAALTEQTGVSVSTLTRAFRHHHGMGPIAYVRRQRLLRARSELLRAEAVPGIVTRVALGCGFAHLSRFAGAYLEMFGELPSETLVRGVQ
jgi:AraC-like DNA-binding protein